MSSISKQPNVQRQGEQDEVGDAALDSVSGGQGNQPVQKMDTIVVTASRVPASTASVQKMDTIVVTASKQPPDLSGTQVASNSAQNKKRS
jgi:hypothetical protein